ncbi:MAG: hypothetical protein Q4C91_15875 [Eubacteriales bacterium]|nr:hypothetical protein [Eubacteriales bacterium]
MFHNKTGYSTREERVEIFQDTLAWIKADPTLSASIVEAKKYCLKPRAACNNAGCFFYSFFKKAIDRLLQPLDII